MGFECQDYLMVRLNESLVSKTSAVLCAKTESSLAYFGHVAIWLCMSGAPGNWLSDRAEILSVLYVVLRSRASIASIDTTMQKY